MAVNLAVIVLRETHVRWYQPSYRTPLYPWVQVIGILMGVVLLFLLGLMAAVAALGIIAGGACFWFLYGRRQMTERKGAVGRLPGRAYCRYHDTGLHLRWTHLWRCGCFSDLSRS